MGQLDVARCGRVDRVVAAAERIGPGVTGQKKHEHEISDRHISLLESLNMQSSF